MFADGHDLEEGRYGSARSRLEGGGGGGLRIKDYRGMFTNHEIFGNFY